jgi:hypothetical protein
MNLNNPIVFYGSLSICFVAILILLFTIRQAIKSGNRRRRGIVALRKQLRSAKIFRTRF